MSNPTAAILIIGNEILSGRTQDMNTNFIAKKLSALGISLLEVRIIPDIEDVIIRAAKSLSADHTYVFTTGGIGATHDDITAASIAKAFGKDLTLNPQALAILTTYYQDRLNDTRKRMAYIPEGASLIENPVSASPGFQIENVYCLAGIPVVMHAMFDKLIPHLNTGTPYQAKTIRSYVLENDIADELSIIQYEFSQVEIGSYPSFISPGKFGVSLVVRGTDLDSIEQATTAICKMIEQHGHVPQID